MIKLTGDSESVPSKFWVIAVEDDLLLSTASTDYNEVALSSNLSVPIRRFSNTLIVTFIY